MKHAPNLEKKLIKVLWCALVFVIAALVLYAIKFAAANGFSLSNNDPAAWGALGEFFGGTLNPLLSLLVFCSLLLTVHLQAVQLDEARERNRFADLQTLMASASATIDTLLRSPIPRAPTLGFVSMAPVIDTPLMAEVFSLFKISELLSGSEERDHHYEQRRSNIEPITLLLQDELATLAWVLARYMGERVSNDLNDFYRMKYFDLVMELRGIGLLTSNETVDLVFGKAQAL